MDTTDHFSAQHVADLRRWRARWLRALRGNGFRAVSQTPVLLVVIPPTVALVRARFPDLPEEDAVGQALRHVAVMRSGGAAPSMDLGTPYAVPIAKSCESALRAFIVTMPQVALRIGWIRDDEDPDETVRRASFAWGRWMKTDPAGKADSALFLDEVWSGEPKKRFANEDELLAVTLCMFVSKKSELPEDVKESTFREFAAPLANAVDAMAKREAPRVAGRMNRRRGRRPSNDDIRSRITSSFFSDGHRKLLAIPRPDGTVLPHENTILGGNPIVDEMRREGGVRRRGAKTRSPVSLDAIAADPLAEDTASDPLAAIVSAEAVRGGRDIREEIETACRARGRATEAAILYIERKAEGERVTRAAVAAEFGVTVRALRRGEDWIKAQVRWKSALGDAA